VGPIAILSPKSTTFTAEKKPYYRFMDIKEEP